MLLNVTPYLVNFCINIRWDHFDVKVFLRMLDKTDKSLASSRYPGPCSHALLREQPPQHSQLPAVDGADMQAGFQERVPWGRVLHLGEGVPSACSGHIAAKIESIVKSTTSDKTSNFTYSALKNISWKTVLSNNHVKTLNMEIKKYYKCLK